MPVPTGPDSSRAESRECSRGSGYDLEEVRRRADIAEIISPHVALRKAGRRLVGLCPFHQERTPSFTVDPEAGLWHCFGCKAGGDLFRFVEMIEKITFSEAVEMLARRLGVLPRTPEAAARRGERERLLLLHAAACEFFRSQLRGCQHARQYLARRGVSESALDEFAIGYAPASWDALLAALGKQGYSGQELANAGLVVPREARSDSSRAQPREEIRGSGYYDRFRDRIIFPIRDATGRVIAFGGRALAESDQPKYLNSPDTLLFQKSRVLYALDRARRAMADSGQAIVVEGYLDAIACHGAGLAQTVATMGTALTAEHVDLLRRRANRLVLGFDADSAGMTAALRGRELFERVGLTVRVVTLPPGMDPDQVVREQGAEAFAGLVGAAAPMIEWELTRIWERVQSASEPDRAEAMREAAAALARLPEGVEREYYTRWVVDRWGAETPGTAARMEEALRAEMVRAAARKREAVRGSQGVATGGDADRDRALDKGITVQIGGRLLAALIRYPETGRGCVAELEPEDFAPGLRPVFAALLALMDKGERVSPEALRQALDAEGQPVLAELALAHVPEDRVEEDIGKLVSRLLERRAAQREAELGRRFLEADTPEEQERIKQELSEARRRRSYLVGRRVLE